MKNNMKNKKTKYTNKTFCFICVFSIYFQKNKMKNHTEKKNTKKKKNNTKT